METYFDTGVLIPLYVEESFSQMITSYVRDLAKPIRFNLLQRLELENALSLKVFRGDISEKDRATVLRKIEEQIAGGQLIGSPVDWTDALDFARGIAAKASPRLGCRTLDVLHVAIAQQWKCAFLVSADDRQLRVARSIGLKTVDIRGRRRPGFEAS